MSGAVAAEPHRNWFGDPFFPIAQGMSGCPEPLGPRVTRAERDAQAHWRVERGTSCYLAGTCLRPNSYRYDADIGQAIQRLLAADPPPGLSLASLWITVQRRFVTIEGCAPYAGPVQALQQRLQAIEGVQQVISRVRLDKRERLPYPAAMAGPAVP